MAWDVFVAYAGPDRPRARALVDALRAHSVAVCFDQDALNPGDDWHLRLPELLRASSIARRGSGRATAWS